MISEAIDYSLRNAQAKYNEIVDYYQCARFLDKDTAGRDLTARQKRILKYDLNFPGGSEYTVRENLRNLVANSYLSMMKRSMWTNMEEELTLDEVKIQLSTGGPAAYIVAEVNIPYGDVYWVKMYHCHWSEPEEMTDISTTDEALLWFCSEVIYRI